MIFTEVGALDTNIRHMLYRNDFRVSLMVQESIIRSYAPLVKFNDAGNLTRRSASLITNDGYRMIFSSQHYRELISHFDQGRLVAQQERKVSVNSKKPSHATDKYLPPGIKEISNGRYEIEIGDGATRKRNTLIEAIQIRDLFLKDKVSYKRRAFEAEGFGWVLDVDNFLPPSFSITHDLRITPDLHKTTTAYLRYENTSRSLMRLTDYGPLDAIECILKIYRREPVVDRRLIGYLCKLRDEYQSGVLKPSCVKSPT